MWCDMAITVATHVDSEAEFSIYSGNLASAWNFGSQLGCITSSEHKALPWKRMSLAFCVQWKHSAAAMAFFYQSDFRIADHYRRTVTDSPLPDEVNLSLTRRSISDMKRTTEVTIPRCLGAQDIKVRLTGQVKGFALQ